MVLILLKRGDPLACFEYRMWNCLVYESWETRSSYIESQPKKVVVVGGVVFVVVGLAVVQI